MNKPDILVVGSINMDLMMYDVENIPKLGESVYCGEYEYATGGKGANQAFAVSMQGANSFLIGRIGKDHNGKRLRNSLNEAGVCLQYMVEDEEHLTGLSTMNIKKDGTYFSIFAAEANNHIQPDDVKKALEQHHFDMVIMQLEMPIETVYRTYELAKEKNIPVFLDAGPAMSISLKRLRGIFIISPNEAETEALTGIVPDTIEHIEQAARWLYKEVKPEYVLLKLGSRGAMLYDGKKCI